MLDESQATLTANLAVGGDLSLIGGALAANTFTTSLTGNWRNLIGTTGFNAGTGLVTLVGASQQLYGSTTFYQFSKAVTSAATLTFPINECQTMTSNLTLTGVSGNVLSIASSTTGTAATIKPLGANRTCSWLSVKDSRNFVLPVLCPTPTNSVNAGNTRCWFNGAGANGVLVGAPGIE